jgi:thiol-disulfide isomerase/thioredoxin
VNRRTFLRIAAASALLLPAAGAFAQSSQYNTSPGLPSSPSGVVVVMLANFFCPRCRTVNDHYDRLLQTAREGGTDMRFAPVSWKGQTLWPDRVYYAARDLYPSTESLIRNAMFDGLQREGMIFESVAQVVAYLERRQVTEAALKLDPNFNLANIAERAAADETMLAEAKAGRLVNMSGAEDVPVFVWLKDGDVIKAISPRDAADPVGLAQRVYRELTTNDTAAKSAP